MNFQKAPRHATDEMVDAAEGTGDLYRMGKPNLWRQVWSNMLAAAPLADPDKFYVAMVTDCSGQGSDFLGLCSTFEKALEKCNANYVRLRNDPDTPSLIGFETTTPAEVELGCRLFEPGGNIYYTVHEATVDGIVDV